MGIPRRIRQVSLKQTHIQTDIHGYSSSILSLKHSWNQTRIDIIPISIRPNLTQTTVESNMHGYYSQQYPWVSLQHWTQTWQKEDCPEPEIFKTKRSLKSWAKVSRYNTDKTHPLYLSDVMLILGWTVPSTGDICHETLHTHQTVELPRSAHTHTVRIATGSHSPRMARLTFHLSFGCFDTLNVILLSSFNFLHVRLCGSSLNSNYDLIFSFRNYINPGICHKRTRKSYICADWQ